MKKFLVSLIVLALCLFTIACGSTTSKGDTDCNPDEEDCDDTNTNTDTDNDSTDPTNPTNPTDPTNPTNPTDPTEPTEPTEPTTESDCNSVICKIQKGEKSEGEKVTTDCVVTGILYNQDKNDNYKNISIKGLYVSDIIPQAKPYTGIYVFIKDSADLGAYEIGDKLEVTGNYSEFYESSQIEMTDIKKLGKADVPEPAEIKDPSRIATPFEVTGQDDKGYDKYDPTANHGPDAESYESVLVKVKGVEVTNKYLGNSNFEVTGGLAIAPTIHKYEGDISKGTKFESIQGILLYSYDAFRLAPRDNDDVVPAIIEEEPSTIKAIQGGEKEVGDLVSIENAIVISPVLSKDFNDGGKGYAFYVSDGTTGDYSGLYIYYVSAETAPAKGDKVTIEGQVDFYNNQWEVKNSKTAGSITKTGTGTVPAVLEKASYTALSDADKGSLIELTDELTVKSVEKPEGKNYTKITFEEKVGDKELIAENFGDVTFQDFQAGDKLHVKGIYDVIFGSNGFYILDAGDLEKRIY